MSVDERFRCVYLAESAHVLRYAIFRVGSSWAEDVVAETFALAWEKFDRLPSPARPWLLATARRITANQLRARRRHATAALDIVDPGFLAVESHSDGVDRSQDLIAALQDLSYRDREAILLVAWHELSNSEAADIVECSVTAFAVRLHRARRRLAKVLQHSDATPAPSATSHGVDQ